MFMLTFALLLLIQIYFTVCLKLKHGAQSCRAYKLPYQPMATSSGRPCDVYILGAPLLTFLLIFITLGLGFAWLRVASWYAACEQSHFNSRYTVPTSSSIPGSRL